MNKLVQHGVPDIVFKILKNPEKYKLVEKELHIPQLSTIQSTASTNNQVAITPSDLHSYVSVSQNTPPHITDLDDINNNVNNSPVVAPTSAFYSDSYNPSYTYSPAAVPTSAYYSDSYNASYTYSPAAAPTSAYYSNSFNGSHTYSVSNNVSSSENLYDRLMNEVSPITFSKLNKKKGKVGVRKGRPSLNKKLRNSCM